MKLNLSFSFFDFPLDVVNLLPTILQYMDFLPRDKDTESENKTKF